jgi:DNA-3-methyladenine glycosylase
MGKWANIMGGHVMVRPIERSFFDRDTATVAQDLLGKQIVHTLAGHTRAGIIVETESYEGTDPACHACHGLTRRNSALFGPVGHAYIYFIYGNHYCLNIVAKDRHSKAGGVLVRAIEPTLGINKMLQARRRTTGYALTNGPGKLTQALGITLDYNHADLTSIANNLYIAEGRRIEQPDIAVTTRIGLSVSQDLPLRFYIKHNRWVSR